MKAIYQSSETPIQQYYSSEDLVCVDNSFEQDYVSDAKVSDDISYEINAFGRQVVAPVVGALVYPVATKLNSSGQYKVNYSIYKTNPDDPMFDGWIKNYYSDGRAQSKISKAIFVGKNGLSANPTSAEIVNLRRIGARQQMMAGSGLFLPQVLRLATTGIAAANSNRNNGIEDGAIAFDMMSVSGNITDSAFYVYGLRQISNGLDGRAVRTLTLSHKANVVSNVLQIVAGGMRMASEGQRYIKTGEMNLSTMSYGALDVGGGGCGIAYSTWIMKRASSVRAGTKIAGDVSKANVLMGATRLSNGLRFGLRAIGVAGSVVGVGINSYAIYNGVFNENLTDQQSQDVVVSGTLGLVGAVVMLGGALLIGSASAPIVGAAFVVGYALLTLQTVYDYRSEIKNFFMGED